MTDFKNIPAPSQNFSASGVVVRLIETWGYRYQRALEGIVEDQGDFRPCEGAMSLSELQAHIFALAKMVHASLFSSPSELESSTENTLVLLAEIRDKLLGMDDQDLDGLSIRDKSFWYAINGPIADALTHVGQVNTYKRLSGGEMLSRNYFKGE